MTVGGETFHGPAGYQNGEGNEQHNNFYAAPPPPVVWPVRVGNIPPLASAYQQRPAVQGRIDRAWVGHETVVLAQVLAGGGGTGKSQLAADYAHRALTGGTDLVVWAPATETTQVIALYARAATRVRAPGTAGRDAQADAEAFLAWLATTACSWLVVLDDVSDPQGMSRWWPPASAGGQGQVLATTRRRDAILSGGGRMAVDIDAYTTPEAAVYLRERLTGAGCAHLLDGTQDVVARALGWLPLALSHAAAYMINEAMPCARYLDLLTARDSRLDTLLPPEADTETYGRQVTAALLLSLDAAQESDPAGLALAALRLAAVLDPAGHPRTIWDTDAVRRYLGSGQGPAVLRMLHRYGLLTDHAPDGPRAVTLNTLTARAVRENTPRADLADIRTTAADALLDIWPDLDHPDPALSTALHANFAASHHQTGHPYDTTTLKEQVTTSLEHLPGPEHPAMPTTGSQPTPAAGRKQTGWATRIRGPLATAIALAAIALTWTSPHQITDRYKTAFSDLGDGSPGVRIDGINALQRIMRDSPRDQPVIIDVLSAYIRTYAPLPAKGTQGPDRPRPDVAAALTAITTRNPHHDGNATVDLANTYLHGAGLNSAKKLRDAGLNEADVQGAVVKPIQMGPGSADPTDVGPGSADPTDVGPGSADPTDVGPGSADPTDVGPGSADPTDVGPGSADPTDVGPGSADPTDVGPGSADPTDVGPGSADPTDVGPGSADPTDVGPGSADPTDVGPASADPLSVSLA